MTVHIMTTDQYFRVGLEYICQVYGERSVIIDRKGSANLPQRYAPGRDTLILALDVFRGDPMALFDGSRRLRALDIKIVVVSEGGRAFHGVGGHALSKRDRPEVFMQAIKGERTFSTFFRPVSLTAWESSVLRGFLSGKSVKQIAESGGRAVGAVYAGKASVLQKLQVQRMNHLLQMF
ncbi:response regulator transcription factor [Salmonella enterica]|nr:response regulator transcription factor [Salmonella enterica]EDP9795112.1 response regulator transcription factor [Salmonella enterica subsp. salamae]